MLIIRVWVRDSDVNKDLGPKAKAKDSDFGLKDQDQGLTSLVTDKVGKFFSKLSSLSQGGMSERGIVRGGKCPTVTVTVDRQSKLLISVYHANADFDVKKSDCIFSLPLSLLA